MRILGIDADERGYPCYNPAKNKLESIILNKQVNLEKGAEDEDKWCRYLRYVFLDKQNVGLEMVKNGMTVARASSNDTKYRDEIAKAEKNARQSKVGCKWNGKHMIAKQPKTNLKWSKVTTELTGLNVIKASKAKNYVGKNVIVEGYVIDTYRSTTNTVFLNFEKPYPNAYFTGVIFSSNQYKFMQQPEDYYLNKTIRIKGIIKTYKSKPEILLESPNQIELGR